MATMPMTNAIGWAQFRLLGGWKNTLLTTGVYSFLLAFAMFASVRAIPSPPQFTYAAYAHVFLGLQVLVLLIYGTMRLGVAVRSDVSTHVIESHRLMPIGGGQAVIGYLLGAPSQGLFLFACTFVLGGIATAGSGAPLQSWAFANGILLAFSFFIWVIVAFFSFRSGLILLGIMIALGGVGMSGGMALTLTPGLQVLASPLIGHTIFDFRGGAGFGWVYATSLALQSVIALLYFLAAARRYRRDEAIGFTPSLGLLLLAAWVVASLMGIVYPDFRPLGRRASDVPEAYLQFTASIAAALLLAVLPVASVTRATDAPPHGSPRSGAFPPLLVSAIAAMIALALTAAQPVQDGPAIVHTAIAAVAFLVGIRYLLGIIYHRHMKPRRLVLVWIILTWGVPIILELLRQVWMEDPASPRVSPLLLLSPIGEIFQSWHPDPHSPMSHTIGLVVQCAIALLLALLYHLRTRQTGALPPAGPALNPRSSIINQQSALSPALNPQFSIINQQSTEYHPAPDSL